MAAIKCPKCKATFELHPTEIIPAGEAVYCANCEGITRRSLNGYCAACGSDATTSLERLLAGCLPECLASVKE